MQAPVLVLNQKTKRETGRNAQIGNIKAASAVSGIIKTTLGPRSMLKMLLDPMGGILLTNDGNAILREVDVSHPAAKSMIELSRAQDEEVGDGTTSVIVLAGEMLVVAEPFITKNIHPIMIVRGYYQAMEECLRQLDKLAIPIDINDEKFMMKLIETTVGTKFISRYGDTMCRFALQAVKYVCIENNGKKEIDLKRYAKVEKVPGGEMSECIVLDGVMINKDITHAKMRRVIKNPRIMLVDCPLEYKKGESATTVEISQTEDWNKILQMEEDYVKSMCETIIKLKPDVIITEKGVSDLAQHYFVKANITAIRRVRKSDNNRIGRACGATIVHRVEEATENDIGTGCGLFEIKKIGDDYFTFIRECKDPKACTILLRGGSKDSLNEVERNLQDAMQVVRNVFFDPRLLPGGGATEMSLSVAIKEQAKKIEGVTKWPYEAVGTALEVIPRTLALNCGADTVRVITELRAKHANGANSNYGIDGINGCIKDMTELGIYDSYQVKAQTIKTAIESACMLLRIDDIVSGMKNKK